MFFRMIFYCCLVFFFGCASVSPKAPSSDVVIKIPADPKKGFNFPYYIYLPVGIEKEVQPILLVQPNNTGKSSDDFNLHDEAAKKITQRGYFRRLSDRLRYPMLIPVFPRPASNSPYIHYLNRKTMKIAEGPLKRVDLQLIAMIEDARTVLAQRDIFIRSKIFMNGFSSSGSFSLRFTALHPEIIQAVSAGGINALPILPLKKFQNQKLPYPIGVADFKEVTGEDFNLKSYLQVPQIIYMGELDTNDTVPFRDSWTEQEAQFIRQLLGEKMMPDRWNKIQNILKGTGANISFKTYSGIDHNVPSEIEEDIFQFFSNAALVP